MSLTERIERAQQQQAVAATQFGPEVILPAALIVPTLPDGATVTAREEWLL